MIMDNSKNKWYQRTKAKATFLNFTEMDFSLEQCITARAILDLCDLCKYGNKEVNNKDKGMRYNITELIEYFSQTTHLRNVFYCTIRLCRKEYGDDKVNKVLHGEEKI